MTPEALEALEQLRQAFIAKHGREPGPDDLHKLLQTGQSRLPSHQDRFWRGFYFPRLRDMLKPL